MFRVGAIDGGGGDRHVVNVLYGGENWCWYARDRRGEIGSLVVVWVGENEVG